MMPNATQMMSEIRMYAVSGIGTLMPITKLIRPATTLAPMMYISVCRLIVADADYPQHLADVGSKLWRTVLNLVCVLT